MSEFFITAFWMSLLSLVIMVILQPLLIRSADRIGAVDHPNDRKIHSISTPRLGGIGIFAGVFVALWVCFFVDPTFLISNGITLKTLWIGGPIALAIGLWDDLFSIGAKRKLVAQLLLGMFSYWMGFRIETLVVAPGVVWSLGLFALPITALWIAGIMNAINLIDGMDGLAAGISTLAFLMIACLSYFSGNLIVFVPSLVLAAATLGFLRFNFSPARMFMGDCGSMFLGFALAVLSLSISPAGVGAIPVYVPLFLLALPLIDMSVAILRRLVQATDEHQILRPEKSLSLPGILRKIFAADGDHIHHRLLLRGWSQKKVVLSLYTFSILANGVGVALYFLPGSLAYVIVALALFFVFQFVMSLEYLEFVPRKIRREQRAQEWEEVLGQPAALIRRVSSN